MKFNYLSFLPLIIIFFSIFSYLLLKSERTFFKWVYDHWFYKRSLFSRWGTLIYLFGFFLLLLSLLDLRGPEERIKATIPQQRTIILIDSSSSMLAEDVRPNRFSKAIIMARHLVKKAVGHQVSVILFSDLTKRVVPFTDDLDLLDARISGLRKLNLARGGSNLSASILESIQFFKSTDDNHKISGNIVVFTDAEEGDGKVEVEVPDGVSLAIVGIGTRKGGNIPLRKENGSFNGYKKFNGNIVTTKLDEKYLKTIGKSAKNYKYWIATSYTLPTEEILKFFDKVHVKKFSQNDIVVQPVYGHIVLAIALVLLTISYLLRNLKTFSTTALLLLVCSNVFAQEESKPAEEGVSNVISGLEFAQEEYLEELKSGEMKIERKLKLAETFLKLKNYESAVKLYKEILDSQDKKNIVALFNYGTALIANQDLDEGLAVYKDILRAVDSQNEYFDKIRDSIRNNVILAFSGQKGGGKGKNSKKNKKNKSKKGKDQNQSQDQQQQNKKDQQQEKQDQNQQGQNSQQQDEQKNDQGSKGQNQNQDEKDGQGKKEDQQQQNQSGSQGKEKQKEQKSNEGENKDQKDKDKNPGDKENEKAEAKKKSQGDSRENNDLDQKRKKSLAQKVKIPPRLKQILSDDRKLQSQHLDTKTNEPKPQERKDW